MLSGVMNIKVDFFNRWFRHSREGPQDYDKKEVFKKAEEKVKYDLCIFNII